MASTADHQEAVRRLCRDVAVVDSVAALLVEAKRSMIEARFLLLSPSPPPVWLRMEQAIAVLEAGVGVIDAAIEEDEPDDDGSQA